MRFILVSILALAAAASAANIPGLPSCAGSCVSTDFGGCGSLNVTCICSNGPLIANLACCVSKVCDQADQDSTIKFADALCQGNGVTNLPTAATCAPGAQSTLPGSGSSSLSLSGTAAAAVSSASSIAANNSTAVGGGAQGASTTVLTGSASGSATRAAASSGTSAATSAKATNAGNKLQAAAGVGALVFGAMAAL
ncbi:hypothetical protein MBLNU457_3740t1 [Dothideomycetes sp. NU457]